MSYGSTSTPMRNSVVSYDAGPGPAYHRVGTSEQRGRTTSFYEREARDGRLRKLVDSGKLVSTRRGEFTVDGFSFWREFRSDPFHCLVDLFSFYELVAIFFLTYTMLIVLFSSLFYLIGNMGDVGDGFHPDNSFWTCFQCAWQSLTTVGYGTTAPKGLVANIVACIAVIISVVVDAIGIGVFYQRMTNASNKTQAIIHSTKAVIRGGFSGRPRMFECRVNHTADHALVEPTARLILARWHSGHNGAGRVSIEFQDLELGNKTNRALLQYPFSLVHFIDDSSPLAKCTTPEALADTEIILIVNGTAAATGNGCEYRASYGAGDIQFGMRYADILRFEQDGTLGLDMDRINQTIPEGDIADWRPEVF